MSHRTAPKPMVSTRLYEVLSVAPDATEEEIKRSFRRLALKLHPDKATGDDDDRAVAERRFKDVNEAYSILSDPVRRKRYDLTGSTDEDDGDEDTGGVSKGGTRRAPPAEYISLDDLISLTFGTTRRRYKILTEEPLLVKLVQLMPLFVFLAIVLSEPSSTPTPYAGLNAPFRMQPGGEYAHERHTAGSTVAFYVRTDFEALIRDDRHTLWMVEAAVESLDRHKWRDACDKQLRQWQLAVNAARRMPKGPERNERVQQAEAGPTPGCTMLRERYAETRSASNAFKANAAASTAHPSAPGQAWRLPVPSDAAAAA